MNVTCEVDGCGAVVPVSLWPEHADIVHGAHAAALRAEIADAHVVDLTAGAEGVAS